MAPSQPSARLSVMPGPGLIGHELRQSTSQEALRRSTMLSGQASGNRGDAGVYRRVSQATRNPPARSVPAAKFEIARGSHADG